LLLSDYGEILASRMTHGIESGDLKTLSSGRTENWSNVLGEMMANPLTFVTGFGWEVFYERVGYRHGTHNVYIDYLYSLGLVGLCLYVAPFISSITLARRTVKEAAAEVVPFLIALVFGLTSFMVAMAFSNVYMASMYVWGMTGALLRLAVAGREPSPSGTRVHRLPSDTVASRPNLSRSRL
jgi:O-antigen ligase